MERSGWVNGLRVKKGVYRYRGISLPDVTARFREK